MVAKGALRRAEGPLARFYFDQINVSLPYIVGNLFFPCPSCNMAQPSMAASQSARDTVTAHIRADPFFSDDDNGVRTYGPYKLINKGALQPWQTPGSWPCHYEGLVDASRCRRVCLTTLDLCGACLRVSMCVCVCLCVYVCVCA